MFTWFHYHETNSHFQVNFSDSANALNEYETIPMNMPSVSSGTRREVCPFMSYAKSLYLLYSLNLKKPKSIDFEFFLKQDIFPGRKFLLQVQRLKENVSINQGISAYNG